MSQRILRGVALVAVLVAGLVAVNPAVAQDEDGFQLGTNTAFCPPEHFGPYMDCTSWEGVTVTYLIVDSGVTETCITSGGERSAACSVVVPYGATVQVSIDTSVIPAGYVLDSPAVQEMTVPDGPPEGLYGGASFVLVETEVTETDETAPMEETQEESADTGTSQVAVLPSTGSGVSNENTFIVPAFVAVAAFLAIGGYRLRQMNRR